MMHSGPEPSCWRACALTFAAFTAVVLVLALVSDPHGEAVAELGAELNPGPSADVGLPIEKAAFVSGSSSLE